MGDQGDVVREKRHLKWHQLSDYNTYWPQQHAYHWPQVPQEQNNIPQHNWAEIPFADHVNVQPNYHKPTPVKFIPPQVHKIYEEVKPNPIATEEDESTEIEYDPPSATLGDQVKSLLFKHKNSFLDQLKKDHIKEMAQEKSLENKKLFGDQKKVHVKEIAQEKTLENKKSFGDQIDLLKSIKEFIGFFKSEIKKIKDELSSTKSMVVSKEEHTTKAPPIHLTINLVTNHSAQSSQPVTVDQNLPEHQIDVRQASEESEESEDKSLKRVIDMYRLDMSQYFEDTINENNEIDSYFVPKDSLSSGIYGKRSVQDENHVEVDEKNENPLKTNEKN